MKIKFFRKANGKHPVIEFLDSLPPNELALIIISFNKLQMRGFTQLNMDSQQLSDLLWEFKVKTPRDGERCFYACDLGKTKENLILLHAYKKISHRTPKREVELAKKNMLEVLSNESAYT